MTIGQYSPGLEQATIGSVHHVFSREPSKVGIGSDLDLADRSRAVVMEATLLAVPKQYRWPGANNPG